MKELPLSKGKVALVDDADYEWLSQWKWSIVKGRHTFYAQRVQQVDGQQTQYLLHRVIMGVTDPQIQVDHERGDGLDNQRPNLRIATRSQNQWNRGRTSRNKSGYKGVHWARHAKKWHAQIMINKKSMHLGYFDDVLDAAHAYEEAARIHHGEFAHTTC